MDEIPLMISFVNGNARFYRLRSVAAPAPAITSVRVVGASVVMNYQ